MSAKFAAYEDVPFGFEMVTLNREVRKWNLWWNVKLTDDPEVWDDEIQSINEMQQGLTELSAEQRLIRAHVAEFCRMHPLFPKSMDILGQEIGAGRLSAPPSVGCEGRGLLDCLGYHGQQASQIQRNEVLGDCARSLGKWLAKGTPEGPRQLRTFRFLGNWTPTKEAFVTQLLCVISSEESPLVSLKDLCENECRKTQETSGNFDCRPFNCFACDQTNPEAGAVPSCQCCHSMLIDSGLLCAGALAEKRPRSDEFNRFIEEYILVYATAANSWLENGSPPPVASLPAGRYVDSAAAQKISERIHSYLGEGDGVKEWLTACLLKTITGNQRWHKSAELIDRFPQATSWLTRKAGPRRPQTRQGA